MIDRTAPTFMLRPKVLLGAAGISGGLFSGLLVACLACWLAGVLAWGLCWLLYILLCVLGYGIVIGGAGLLAIGGVNAATKSKSGDNNAGCGIIVLLLIALGIVVKGCTWISDLLQTPRALFVGLTPDTGWDDVAWTACFSAASFLLNDLFLEYQVYLYSWSVLSAALAGASVNLFVLALLLCERPIKTVFQRIRYRCKRCGDTRLQFRCPGTGCSAWHDDLRPSVYGLFRASCPRCKTALATTDLFGRLKLEQACANAKCGGAADAGIGEMSEYHLAVVGAQSSGKSCFLFATVWRFLDFAAANSLQVDFPDPAQKREFDDYVRSFQVGRPIPKTISRERPLAFTLDIATGGGAHSRLYLYDAAGEDFEAGDLTSGTHGLSGFDFFNYVDGILFVVDPLAEELAGQVRPGDNPAKQESSYLLSRLLPVLERAQKTLAGRRIPVPIAVVVTKSDGAHRRGESTSLLAQLKHPALGGACASLSRAADDAAADSPLVRAFLQDIGAADVVQLLESSFFDVRYFAVSALGHGADPSVKTSFQPLRVVEPTIWLGHQSQALSNSLLASRAWRNATDFACRSLRGQEGSLLRFSTWGILLAVLMSWSGLCWYVGGPMLAVSGTSGAIVLPFLVLRIRSRGAQDVIAVTDGTASLTRWVGDSLRGRNGRKDLVFAVLLISLALATVGGILLVVLT